MPEKTSVGIYEAKTNLARLVDRVERGEVVTITRHNRPVAVMSPPAGAQVARKQSAAAEIRRLRKGKTLGDLSVRELIESGRE